MVVDEDTVAVFLTEPPTSDDIREGFVGYKEDSASESDLTFHPWVPERIARPSINDLPDSKRFDAQTIRVVS